MIFQITDATVKSVSYFIAASIGWNYLVREAV